MPRNSGAEPPRRRRESASASAMPDQGGCPGSSGARSCTRWMRSLSRARASPATSRRRWLGALAASLRFRPGASPRPRMFFAVAIDARATSAVSLGRGEPGLHAATLARGPRVVCQPRHATQRAPFSPVGAVGSRSPPASRRTARAGRGARTRSSHESTCAASSARSRAPLPRPNLSRSPTYRNPAV